MIIWNKSVLSIDFDATSINDRTMSLIITNNNRCWKFLPLPVGKTTWSTEIFLPTRISFVFGGKQQNDTKVDAVGNIVENMSVNIKNVRLDGISCWEYWTELSTVLECDDSDEILLGKNISSNGQVSMSFDDDNALFWLIQTKLS